MSCFAISPPGPANSTPGAITTAAREFPVADSAEGASCGLIPAGAGLNAGLAGSGPTPPPF